MDDKKRKKMANALVKGVKQVSIFSAHELDIVIMKATINSLKVEIAALSALIIEKGVATEREVDEISQEMMTTEVEAYEARLTNLYGKRVSLT